MNTNLRGNDIATHLWQLSILVIRILDVVYYIMKHNLGKCGYKTMKDPVTRRTNEIAEI